MITQNKKQLTVVGIIPARGGSKGVPRKNIKPLCGKPLIAYSIEEAKKSRFLDRIIVSTEDKEISNIALKYGAEIIIRPKELATDLSPTEPTLIHVVQELQNKEGYGSDIVVLLQPTTPFRKAAYIDEALEQLITHPTADSIVSVYEAPQKFNPHWCSRINDNGLLVPYLDDHYFPNRQSLPKIFWRDGQIYAVYTQSLIKNQSRYGEKGTLPYFNNKDKYHINIDDISDFWMAEYLIKHELA